MNMEQRSNPIGAGAVCKQADVEYGVQSNPLYRHDANSCATESPGA